MWHLSQIAPWKSPIAPYLWNIKMEFPLYFLKINTRGWHKQWIELFFFSVFFTLIWNWNIISWVLFNQLSILHFLLYLLDSGTLLLFLFLIFLIFCLHFIFYDFFYLLHFNRNTLKRLLCENETCLFSW